MDWPATLPVPLVSGYSFGPVDATVRTDMDAGPARVRRRFTDTPDMLKAAWRFTEAQMAAFRAFWEDDIASGAAWFNLSLRDGRAAGMATRACRFNGPFHAQYEGAGIWTVQGELEVRLA